MLDDDLAELLLAQAVQRARDLGCTCHPDATVIELVPGLFDASVAHDADCRLILRCAAVWN